MIDYIKILLINPNIQSIQENELLDFKIEVSEQTGVCANKLVAKYHYCTITIYDSGIVLFTGSIHKLYNSLKDIKAPNHKTNNLKGFNGNIFTLDNIIEVKEHLCNLLDCKSEQMIFQNIEFGINTEPNFNSQLFIKSLLYQHGKEFEFRYNKHYAQVTHQRYLIKIYNKGIQYGMNKNVLRIETKYLKAIEFVKETGIKTFADINTNKLNKALELLIKRFDEIVYHDSTVDKNKLNKRQLNSLRNYSNINYWFDTLKPQQRDRHVKRLSKIINENSKNLHLQLRDNLKQKCVIFNRLLKEPNCVIINSSNIGLNITQNTPLKSSKKTEVNTHEKPRIKSTAETVKKGNCFRTNKKGKSKRICFVTGLNISMQKDSSCLLSHTGIKYYLKNDKSKLDEVTNKYLPKNWVNSSNEVQITELAHNIRNKYYNRNRNTNPNQPTLF